MGKYAQLPVGTGFGDLKALERKTKIYWEDYNEQVTRTGRGDWYGVQPVELYQTAILTGQLNPKKKTFQEFMIEIGPILEGNQKNKKKKVVGTVTSGLEMGGGFLIGSSDSIYNNVTLDLPNTVRKNATGTTLSDDIDSDIFAGNYSSSYAKGYYAGRVVGDLGGMVVGGLEFLGGFLGEKASYSFGCVGQIEIAVPGTVISKGVRTLGAGTGAQSSYNLNKDIEQYRYYSRRSGNSSGKEKTKPYSNPKNRPKYGKGQVDEVWDNAKDVDGKVFDPNTGEELFWDKSKPRTGQWDMGHTPEAKYSEFHRKYMNGEIDYETFLKEYRNSKNYRPESIPGNRSHKYE
jgi:hypothetical protein